MNWRSALRPPGSRSNRAGSLQRRSGSTAQVPSNAFPGSRKATSRCKTRVRSWSAWVVDPGPSDRIADLCAGPGGKSTHLAELAALRRRGTTAHSSHCQRRRPPHKVGLVEANALRLGLDGLIRTMVADVRTMEDGTESASTGCSSMLHAPVRVSEAPAGPAMAADAQRDR